MAVWIQSFFRKFFFTRFWPPLAPFLGPFWRKTTVLIPCFGKGPKTKYLNPGNLCLSYSGPCLVCIHSVWVQVIKKVAQMPFFDMSKSIFFDFDHFSRSALTPFLGQKWKFQIRMPFIENKWCSHPSGTIYKESLACFWRCCERPTARGWSRGGQRR